MSYVYTALLSLVAGFTLGCIYRNRALAAAREEVELARTAWQNEVEQLKAKIREKIAKL